MVGTDVGLHREPAAVDFLPCSEGPVILPSWRPGKSAGSSNSIYVKAAPESEQLSWCCAVYTAWSIWTLAEDKSWCGLKKLADTANVCLGPLWGEGLWMDIHIEEFLSIIRSHFIEIPECGNCGLTVTGCSYSTCTDMFSIYRCVKAWKHSMDIQ